MRELMVTEIHNVSGGVFEIVNEAKNVVKDVIKLFDHHKGVCQCFNSKEEPIGDWDLSQRKSCIKQCCGHGANPKGAWILSGSHHENDNGHGPC